MLVLTARRMPSRKTDLNPCSSLDVVDAVGMLGNVKLPVSFVTGVVRDVGPRLSGDHRDTRHRAPVWSVMVPRIVPRVACAKAGRQAPRPPAQPASPR